MHGIYLIVCLLSILPGLSRGILPYPESASGAYNMGIEKNPSSVTTSVLPVPHIGTAVQCNNGLRTTDTWITKSGSYYMVLNDQFGTTNLIADAYSFVSGQDPYFNIQKLMIMSLPLFCSPKMSSVKIIYPTSNGKVPTIQCDRANNATRHVVQLWVQANKNSYSVVYQFGTTYTSHTTPVIESNYDFIPGQDPLVNAQEAWLRLSVLACSSDYATLKFLTPVTEAVDNSYIQCDRADDSFKARFALLWAASITNIQHQVYIQDSSTSSDNRTIGNTEGGDGEDPKFDALKIRDLWADLLCSGDYQVFELLPTNMSAPICESLLPCADNTYDVGAPTDRWRDIYAGTFVSTPLLILNGVSYTTLVISVSGTAGQISVTGTAQNPIVGLVNVGTPGNCNYPTTITTDPQGRQTACTSGTAPVLSVTGVSGDITCTAGQNPVCDLVTVSSGGTCSYPTSVTFDTKGRETTCTSGSAPVLSVSGTSGDITCTAGQNPVCDLVSVVTGITCDNPDQIRFDNKGRVTGCIPGGTTTGSTVTSVTGTVNEITATGTSHVVLSIPNQFEPPGFVVVGNPAPALFYTESGSLTARLLAINPPNTRDCPGTILDFHAHDTNRTPCSGSTNWANEAAGRFYNTLDPFDPNDLRIGTNYTSWEFFTFLEGPANAFYNDTIVNLEAIVFTQASIQSSYRLVIGIRAGLGANINIGNTKITQADAVRADTEWRGIDFTTTPNSVEIIQFNGFNVVQPEIDVLDTRVIQAPAFDNYIGFNCDPISYSRILTNLACFKAQLPTAATNRAMFWLASDTTSMDNGFKWGSSLASPKTNLYLSALSPNPTLRTDKDFTVGGNLNVFGTSMLNGNVDCETNLNVDGYITVGTGIDPTIIRLTGSISALSLALGDKGQNEFNNASTAEALFVNQTLPETSGVISASFIFALVDPPTPTTAVYEALVVETRTVFNNQQTLNRIIGATVNVIHDGIPATGTTGSNIGIIEGLVVNNQFGSWNPAAAAQEVYGVHSMLMPVPGLTGVTGIIELYSAFRSESPTFQSIGNVYSVSFDCAGWMGGNIAACYRSGTISTGSQKFGFWFQSPTQATWNGISWTDASLPATVLSNLYLRGPNMIANDFDIGYRHTGSKQAIGSCVVGSGAGTGATCSISGSDHGGKVTVNTGTLPVVGNTVVQINFGATFGGSNLNVVGVVITPGTTLAAARASNILVAGISNTQFLITNTGLALVGSSGYIWYYHVDAF